MSHRIIKFFSISCLVLILVLTGVLGWYFLSAQAEDIVYELAGWYYSDNYGWISLNSDNPEFGETGDSQDYKVTVVNGEISGWGWSEYVGWVCFGKTCHPNNICGESSPCNSSDFGTVIPPGGWTATINVNTPPNQKIEGWAKIITLNDYGWIHLGMGVAAGSQPGVICYDCQPKCDQWTISGDPPASGPPCITYSTTEFDSCNSCFTRTKFDNGNIPDLLVDSVVGGSGNTCFNCVTCNKIFSGDGNTSRVACSSCANCYLYGGASDSQTGGLLGWGWNGNAAEASTTGAGWVQFSPANGESGLVYPWLQTQYGTVYGSTLFRQRAIVSGINATYCIFADSIYNFSSQNCLISGALADKISGIKLNFPLKDSNDQSYKNALGRLDIYGLSTPAKINGNRNKYGNIIEAASNRTWSGTIDLNNKVYVLTGDLVIGGELTVNNGASGFGGDGLVIINGNLLIKSNIKYDLSFVDDSAQLASVAWIVKGDVRIEPNVTEAVGAFIILGADGSNCSFDDFGDYPKFPRENKCGVFSSGVSPYPLVISGLLMAKAFNFERSYSNITQGSEKIVYDGRLMANPPPGLKSLLEALPVIRDFEYR